MQLDKAIVSLKALSGDNQSTGTDIRARLIVALTYIIAVVSVPVDNPGMLVWMLCYPILMSEASGLGYARIFSQSLWALPIVAVVGIFNPWLDHTPMWQVGSITVSRGWVSFMCLTLRGLLTVQALLILIESSGFQGMCRALSSLGMPDILVTQLMMMYRYIIVVLDEALVMHRSRQARGFGRKSYPLRMWGTFIGQLMIRSIQRASRVNRAMVARGYKGQLDLGPSPSRFKLSDAIYLVAWIAVFAAIRLTPLTSYVSTHLLHTSMT